MDDNSNIYMTVLLRLIFIPFGFTSYILGVTSLPLCPYLIGTSVYCIKASLYCFMGCALYQLHIRKTNGEKGYENIAFLAEILATGLFTVFISLQAKKVFENKLRRKSIQSKYFQNEGV